jgi:UDP-N-acetylglucosamine/UDP-N-acetylgalactosamine diphosphorylase
MTTVVSQLLQRGVNVHCPESVCIDASVRPDRIADGVVIHAGCRITGPETFIGPGCVIGIEEPATLDNCQLGAAVSIGGGYFSHVTLLDQVSIAAGAHMRPGTLLEEQASCGHTVGLKQTILMPFAVTGSLINFCDALLSGGASRSNHSEIGSSYVHFNYTPHQDKATPSLLGDVPRGVMLDQPPIFLGGQGGLVGPVRVNFGTIVAAGSILRRDVTQSGQLVVSQSRHTHTEAPYDPVIYSDVGRILANNFLYLGNLFALLEWYRHTRQLFVSSGSLAPAIHAGAMARIQSGIEERMSRLAQLAGKLEQSVAAARRNAKADVDGPPFRLQREFAAKWPEGRDRVLSEKLETVGARNRDGFLAALETHRGAAQYLEAVATLPAPEKASGTAWLQAIVERISSRCSV